MNRSIGLCMMMSATIATAQAPTPPDPAAQKAALAGLAALDGTWRGTATVYERGKPPLQLVHTERAGPMLGGALKVIEGKSFTADGKEAGFNALAVISCEKPDACEMRSYARGQAGTFPITIRDGSYTWSFQPRPGLRIAYTATNDGKTWSEEGWIEMGGKPVAKIFEMKVMKVGPTDWPAAGAMTAR